MNHLDCLARIQGDNFWKSEDFAPKRRMIERLRQDFDTPYYYGFYHHEMAEAQENTKYERYHPSTRGFRF